MKYYASLLALATSASAHMLLEYPIPFATNGNGPVDNSASDFPCRVASPAAYTVTSRNAVKAGEQMQVKFRGGATHGGGSCQFSLTPDKAPTKDSQWKVIHSVIGNCLTTEGGNMSGDKDFLGTTPITVTIPKDLPDGDYTFSWSWLNKVGNREFYHNCAPITVSGGSGSDVTKALGGLPDMFVANIPREKCHTTEGEDFNFPNPGQSVQKGSAQVKLGNTLTGDCAAMIKMGAGNGKLGSPSPPSGGSPSGVPSSGVAAPTGAPPASGGAPSATGAPSYGAPSGTPVPSNPGGIFAPSASSAAPVQTTLATVPSPPSPTGGAPNNNTPPASGECTPCTNDGGVVCIGSSSFGLCNRGCAVAQQLAAGMTCANGAITRRSVRRFPRAHLNRRHGSNLV